jgi:ribosome-associated toxin RatA of RatAB toxin-antitoxin module
MRRVQRSAIVPFSDERMYALVNDVRAYPEFLPWCRATRVVEESDTGMRASLQLARNGVQKWFTTINTLDPGARIDLRLADGPFRHLEGHWRFEPLGAEGCRVALDVSFEFDSMLLNLSFGPALEQIFGSLLDAFVKRAAELHGGR